MWSNIGIGLSLLVITTVIHALCMVVTMKILKVYVDRHGESHSAVHALSVVAGSILLMFGAAILEVLTWATTYLKLGAIEGLEPAIYFSTVTYTTLGYGDMVLDEQWRLLASFEAAVGIIMFGWSTAVVVAVVQRAYAAAMKRQRAVNH